MRALSAAVLLDVWERGQPLAPARRAVLLLEAAAPDEAPEALAALPVGRRDARLLALRAQTFGPRLESLVACPACGETLELNLAAEGLRADAPGDVPEVLSVEHAGYAVRFRLPTAGDLVEAAEGDGAVEDAGQLLARCVVEARHGDAVLAADALPGAVAEAVAAQMEAADPQADVRLALTCPACAHAWQSAFDIVTFFWAEIDAWGRRTLRDVHALASAYGWREADVLAMSAWRRQAYLNLVYG